MYARPSSSLAFPTAPLLATSSDERCGRVHRAEAKRCRQLGRVDCQSPYGSRLFWANCSAHLACLRVPGRLNERARREGRIGKVDVLSRGLTNAGMRGGGWGRLLTRWAPVCDRIFNQVSQNCFLFQFRANRNARGRRPFMFALSRDVFSIHASDGPLQLCRPEL